MKILTGYIRGTAGATALEFALIAPVLMIMIFSIIEISYKIMLQAELDEKLYAVASDISINAHDAEDAAEFLSEHFCPKIGTNFLRCSDVEIGVRTITGSTRLVSLRDERLAGEWNLGTQNDAVIIELNYPARNMVHPVTIGDIIFRNGDRYYRSRGVIRREPLLTELAST